MELPRVLNGAFDSTVSALEVLRDAFNLANWTGDPCDTVDWISCTGAKTNVEGINLRDRRLTGSIPAEFSTLVQIRELDLSLNPQLEGDLPDLTAFIILNFNASFCNLTGTIPDLRRSTNLEILHLQSNNFVNVLPQALFQHSYLTDVNLSSNPQLTGTIPSTTQATELKNFVLNDCAFTGAVPAFSANAKLEHIALQNNRLTSFPFDLQAVTALNTINVDNNAISGSLPNVPVGSSQSSAGNQVERLIFSNNFFSGGIPSSWTQLTYVQEIRINNNNLSGPLPDDLSGLRDLETLDLRNNRFNGTVPRTLAELSNLKNLWLDNNNFTGIPQVLQNKAGLNISYGNNPNILTILDPNAKSGFPVGAIVGVVVAVLGIGVGIAVLTILYRRRKKKGGDDQVSKEDMPSSAQSFSLKEIKAITQNYKTLIGKGGFGPVYYGKLPDGKEVAVKVRASDSKQGADEFLNEVRLLSRLHHRNLVSLVGYCLEAQQQILLYVYMPQGTLQDHLFRSGSTSTSNPSTSTSDNSIVSSSRETMSWKKRLDVAISAGRGLEYLHKDCKPPVIHRDVKSANILLTDKLQAKVADLGISKQAPELDSEEAQVNTGVSTVIKGTFGYLDPEYYVRRRLTTKSDVYSFGMVLLEIITGRKPQSHRFPKSSATTLTEWVRNAVNADQIETIVDPALRNQYVREGMIKVAELALMCQLPRGAQRPEMGEVVRALTQAIQMEGVYVDSSARTNDYDYFAGDEEDPNVEDPVSGHVSIPLSTASVGTSRSTESDPICPPALSTIAR
ncbi:hypothetical protein AXG93_3472s1030 [Marchantia polymorpha subsp. ruderalis]|uniref:Protein kinase domain-containing protein n=1 Tax=Marchantia polymorpha subsp. ruderalis TaxID=1480154 RepID=A0A176WMU2_MARPO|nr:hypothetical protein AXG93_3472s1030 [Marchantia polymorpha subsp. ruderalis]